MKNYIYIVNKKNNDRDGHPRSIVTVYDINQITPEYPYPRFIKAELIGYRDPQQAAFDMLSEAGLLILGSHDNGAPYSFFEYIKNQGVNVQSMIPREKV